MATYRYLLTNLLTGDVLAEMPFESAKYSHVLNAPGAFSGTLGLKQPTKLQSVLQSALTLPKGMYVERDGVIVWGGILWTSSGDIDEGSLALNGEGWLSYFRRRVLRKNLTYTATEQVTIAKGLLDDAQGVTGGSLGIITTGNAATGVTRDRSYLAIERRWIGEALEQLAAVENGFDFRFESRWNGGALETRFLTSFPASGRQTNFVFEAGKQLAGLKVDTDATALATNVDATGAGEGDAQLIATISDPGLLSSYPLLDDVVSHTDVTGLATLEGYARKRLLRGSAPIVIPSAEVDPALEPVVGSYVVGDIVRVRGGLGVMTIDQLSRITEYSVSVDDNGAEAGNLTFATLEVFA